MCLVSALKNESKQSYMLHLFLQMHPGHRKTGSHEVSLDLNEANWNQTNKFSAEDQNSQIKLSKSPKM